ncbi:BrnT family toxin [Nitrincola alkalilacustris]|uniref:BrnT family toxin n=1 Tax=Nitrincola alkalilacustris TaxID=1571224 RepID=UPI00124C577B|nr:BrnT family toxin [Nitrincola alkalilacustris]
MEIEFDSAKDAVNREKHGVSLSAAYELEWETLWCFPDDRKDYGEQRMVGFAYIGLRLFNVVFTDRDEVRRIISLRKANSREVNRYAKA